MNELNNLKAEWYIKNTDEFFYNPTKRFDYFNNL